MNTNISKLCDAIIGETALDIVQRQMKSLRQDSTPGGERPFFRIKNLTSEESLAFINSWEQHADDPCLIGMKLVVAADFPGEFLAKYRADRDKSITYYRGRNTSGLVYLETKVESDAQGLKNIFSLTDRNFLDGTFDLNGDRVPRRIINFAWKIAGNFDGSVETLLADRLLQVLDLIHPATFSVSVRTFTAFVIAVISERTQLGGNLDPEETSRLVGRNLVELGLFPDEQWRLVRESNESRIHRRLELNGLYADLANSNSSDLDQEKVIEQAQRTMFKDLEGGEYDETDQQEWRKHCVSYCENPLKAVRTRIPFFIFEQLFRKDVKGLLLGDRVKNEIISRESKRDSEFDGLELQSGLNRRLSEDAQKFLEAQPFEADELPLRDLLSQQTRRMVEKVAFPVAERFVNPLIKIAEIAGEFRGRNVFGAARVVIEVRLAVDENFNSPAIGLFAFIYANTLKSVVENSGLQSGGVELKVDDRLITVRPPPTIPIDEINQGDEDTETNDLESTWKPLPVEFRLISVDDGLQLDAETGYEWLPTAHERVALLWLMLAAPDAPPPEAMLGLPDEISLEHWLTQVADRLIPIDSAVVGSVPVTVVSNNVFKKQAEIRKALAANACINGISHSLLDDVFDQWREIIEEAKRSLVPNGQICPIIAAIMSRECVTLEDRQSMLMLPSHPFRLKWLAGYLAKTEALLLEALAGDLPLNHQNKEMYLEWIASLSPHQQPPVSCNPDGNLLFATGELGWAEEFHPLDRTLAKGQTSSIDLQATDEITNQIKTYLEAHPYKIDGMSLLIVLQAVPAFPGELLKRLKQGDLKSLSVKVHILAPKEIWEQVTRSFEEIPVENRMNSGNKLFPPIQLEFLELQADTNFKEILSGLNCDLAIIPKFLNDGLLVQENTESPLETGGSFDPLLDRSTFVYGGTKGGSISVSMRPPPSSPSPSMDAWSSLAVRNHRTRPVAPMQPENIDFVELKIDFSRTSNLFESVHRSVHWVITLERYITRQQIENLAQRPEILTVRENIGSGGLFTLIVSSNSGRHFIIDRLVRKLKRIVNPPGIETGFDAKVADLAERIYLETRLIAPRLALQAMGISRVTEEIVGLTVARNIAAAQVPSIFEDGVVAWISLDEHQDWFVGTSAIRADLLRITLQRKRTGLVVDILVVEGKLRQVYEPHGEEQVRNTLLLVDDTLPPVGDGIRFIDADVWRERIISAIEGAAPEAKTFYGAALDEAHDHHQIPKDIRKKFRAGDFTIGDISGLYSICLYDSEGVFNITNGKDKRVRIARSYKRQILDLISTEPLLVDIVLPQQSKTDSKVGVDTEFDIYSPNTTLSQRQEPLDTFDNQIELSAKMPGGSNASPQPNHLSTLISVITESTTEKVSTKFPEELINLEKREMLSKKELERRYQLILDTYGQFEISVHRAVRDEDRFIEGPASVIYRIREGDGVDPKSIYAKADSLKLKLSLEEKHNIRFSIHDGYVNIDVPKKEDERYFIDAEKLWQRWSRPANALSTPLGENHVGQVVDLCFSSSNSPHLLIGGTTGSGKSEALNTIISGMVAHYSEKELRLLLIDPKSTELVMFADCPHIIGNIGYTAGDALSILQTAVEEMQLRYEKFRQARKRDLPGYNQDAIPDNRFPWWVIVLDEYADLTSNETDKKNIEALLKRLAQKARASGIHVIVATQKPSSEIISTSLRANLPAQLCLRVKSATESRVIMDEAGGETLNGKGDAFLKADGNPIRLQCARYNKNKID